MSASLAAHGKIAHDADGAKLAAAFAAKWQEHLGFQQKVINFGRPRRATTHTT